MRKGNSHKLVFRISIRTVAQRRAEQMSVIIGPREKNHSWRSDLKVYPISVGSGKKRINGELLIGKNNVSVYFNRKDERGKHFLQCPKCTKEFTGPVLKAVSDMTGKKVRDSSVVFSVAGVSDRANPVKTRSWMVSDECGIAEFTYIGTCPVHGKVKVVDEDAID